MQNTMVQIPGRKCVQEMAQSGRKKQDDSQSPELACSFLQIIMNMIDGGLEVGTKGNFQGGSEGEALEAQGQIFPATCIPLSVQNSLVFEASQLLGDLQRVEDAGELENLLAQAQKLSETGMQEKGAETDLFVDEGKLQSLITHLVQKTDSGQNASMESMDIKNVLLEKGTVNVESHEGLPLKEEGFSERISKVKEMMSSGDTTRKEDGEEINVDKLQNELSQGKAINSFEFKLKSVSHTAQPNCTEQIEEGIKQNLFLGKKEFTIKLKPQSLGEITVKLVERAGKTTLSISAESTQTARLINGDLLALKEAVAPINVHVNEVPIQTNTLGQADFQQFDMSGQQFQGQQYQGQQNFQGYSHMSGNYQDDVNITMPKDDYSSLSQARSGAGKLDAFI